MFSESVYLKIKEPDSFLIRLSLAFILHWSFGFLCLESELIIMQLTLTHSRLFRELTSLLIPRLCDCWDPF